MIAGLLTSCLDFNAMAQEVPPAYIEPRYALRFYPGNEDTRVGWAHLASGNYGLAEQHYRRVVEATPQNGSAWIGSRPLMTGWDASTWRISPTGTPFGSKAKTISSSTTGAIPTSSEGRS